MTRTLLLLIVLATLTTSAHAKPPNVLILLADDMGFSDAGCFGGEIRTPNLDALAKDGLRFTQFYNTARCWPSRAALLTGYYAQQVRRDTLPGVPKTGAQGTRPAWAGLLPEYLKPLGYRTYHSGKWHIDGPRLKAGFDRSYSIEDHDRHFYPRVTLLDDVRQPPIDPVAGNYFSATAIADHAIDFLKQHQAEHADQPFFAYVAFISPHFPLQAPAEDIARYKGKYDAGWDDLRAKRATRQKELGITDCAPSPRVSNGVPPWNLKADELAKRIGPGEVAQDVPWDTLTPVQRTFQAAKMSVHAAMVDRMDQEIGRVLAQVDAMGATGDTIVLFCSDNGASAEQIIRGDGHDPTAPIGSAKTFLGLGPGFSSAANAPLRLHKSWVHEGGISTPLIVRWPNGIAAKNELRRNVGHLIDVAPTILELAGGHWPTRRGNADVPPPPGESLVPVFTKDNSVRHEDLWWFHEGNRALRVGDWKLVSAGKGGPWELYDLAKDRGETTDLAKQFPDRVTEMSARWQQHLADYKALATKDLPPK
jgi:arylsulfatase